MENIYAQPQPDKNQPIMNNFSFNQIPLVAHAIEDANISLNASTSSSPASKIKKMSPWTHDELKLVFGILADRWPDYQATLRKCPNTGKSVRQRLFIEIADSLANELDSIKTDQQVMDKIKYDVKKSRDRIMAELKRGLTPAQSDAHMEEVDGIIRKECEEHRRKPTFNDIIGSGAEDIYGEQSNSSALFSEDLKDIPSMNLRNREDLKRSHDSMSRYADDLDQDLGDDAERYAYMASQLRSKDHRGRLEEIEEHIALQKLELVKSEARLVKQKLALNKKKTLYYDILLAKQRTSK